MLLNVKNLEVCYDNRIVLHNINLEVEAGTIVCILGNNGAGKSTLLKALVGLKSSHSGEIIFNGKHIEQFNTERIVREGICLVPERGGVFGDLSVLDNLMMGAFTRRDRKSIAKDLDNIFELFPILKTRAKQKAGTLSGGEQQMLSIGRGLMSKPTLIALDEPSLGLAPLVIKEIEKNLKTLQATGLAILLIEQNSNLGLSSASKAYVLEDGKIVMSGTSEEIKNNDRLRKVYLGIT
ncbi:MAG: ABC transporter ATP-binding protein [Actinomycetota bacterium]